MDYFLFGQFFVNSFTNQIILVNALYSAPECFGRKKHPPYDYKCDVWSAGTTYLTMMSGSHIIQGNGGHNLRRHGYKYIKNNFETGWNGMSDLSKAVLTSTLIPDPRDRCEAEDIVRLLA